MVWTKYSSTSFKVSNTELILLKRLLFHQWNFLYYLFRKLVKYDDWCSIAIHVAMDNNIVTEEISKFINLLLLNKRKYATM